MCVCQIELVKLVQKRIALVCVCVCVFDGSAFGQWMVCKSEKPEAKSDNPFEYDVLGAYLRTFIIV